MMAYCMWPEYSDHIFAVLSGDGNNGKSTLIEIMGALLGPTNISYMNMHQLSTNRFMPADLQGKLVNLCEETKRGDEGDRMSHVDVEVLKNLSAGGTVQAERKGQDSFSFRNRAKMIFAANNPPKFTEAGDALRRRLLVIPFTYKILDMDSNVGIRLTTTEIPGIMGILIKRLRANVRANGGKFKVSRGGADAAAAQDAMLASGNTVVQWAKESIENAPDETFSIEISEAYTHYKEWCDVGGFTYPKTIIKFGKDLRSYVFKNERTAVLRKGTKTVKVYTHTKYQEGATQ